MITQLEWNEWVIKLLEVTWGEDCAFWVALFPNTNHIIWVATVDYLIVVPGTEVLDEFMVALSAEEFGELIFINILQQLFGISSTYDLNLLPGLLI